MRFLLCDFGSTFVKYFFYSPDGEATEERALPFPAPAVNDGRRYEVSRAAIDEILSAVLRDAAAAGCDTALFCVQMHGYFRRTADGFSDYVSWKDTRGDENDSRVASFDFSPNGTRRKPNLPAVGMCSFPEDPCEFYTFGSYLAYRLTGHNITHLTDACASGFFAAEDGRVTFSLPGVTLPAVTAALVPIGQADGLTVYPPVGDQQASFLGTGTDGVLLNIGTAAQLCALSDEPLSHSPLESRPYFLPGKRLRTLSGLPRSDGETFAAAVARALPLFGENTRLTLAGGGANAMLPALQKALPGIRLTLCPENAGRAGLLRLASALSPARGTMLSEIAFPNFPLLMKKAGLDFVLADDEHGIFDPALLTTMAQNAAAAGISFTVRLPDNSRPLITKLCDGGVHGFLLPMTNAPEDIAQVVRYARYAPDGKRGVSTTRAHTGYGVEDLAAYMTQANRNMKIYAQIETVAGVENAAAIAAEPGVDGLFIGPNDLSADAGIMGNKQALYPYIKAVCRAASAAGKTAGIITTDRDLIRYALLCGATAVSIGSEIHMMKSAAKRIAAGGEL